MENNCQSGRSGWCVIFGTTAGHVHNLNESGIYLHHSYISAGTHSLYSPPNSTSSLSIPCPETLPPPSPQTSSTQIPSQSSPGAGHVLCPPHRLAQRAQAMTCLPLPQAHLVQTLSALPSLLPPLPPSFLISCRPLPRRPPLSL